MGSRVLAAMVVLFAIAVVWFAVSPEAAAPPAPAPAKPSREALLAQGKYLVDRVCVCGGCHTPRTEKGAYNMSNYLRGADVPYKPATPAGIWVSHAPDITAPAMRKYTTDELATLLKGKTGRDGQPVRVFQAPMPPYRLNDTDALAVATYLKSLAPK